MSTILVNRESGLKCQDLESVVIKSEPKTVPQTSTKLKHLCVSGIKCNKRMCLVDLKDIYDIEKYFGNKLICDECFNYLSYNVIDQNDRLVRWTAVETTDYLRQYLRLVEINGCGCTYDDCKIKECDRAEQIQMIENFRSILFNYSFESLPLTSVEMFGYDG